MEGQERVLRDVLGQGLLGGGVAPYDYVEIIDIADADMFGQDVATEKMQEIAAEFSGMAEATFLTTEPL
jgi:hypothetical protein